MGNECSPASTQHTRGWVEVRGPYVGALYCAWLAPLASSFALCPTHTKETRTCSSLPVAGLLASGLRLSWWWPAVLLWFKGVDDGRRAAAAAPDSMMEEAGRGARRMGHDAVEAMTSGLCLGVWMRVFR